MSQSNTRTPNSKTDSSRSSDSDCRICSNILDEEQTQKPLPDRPILETEDFICTPTVGSLVEGYVLTIPKDHVISSGALDQEYLSQFWNFTLRVREGVSNRFGQSIIFEHGPKEKDTVVGCGVDHAHMHVVPIEGSAKKIANNLNPTPIEWQKANSIAPVNNLHNSGKEYLLYLGQEGDLYIGQSDTIKSQLFRRAIARITDQPEKFDWNDHRFQDNVSNTFHKLKNEFCLDNSPWNDGIQYSE